MYPIFLFSFAVSNAGRAEIAMFLYLCNLFLIDPMLCSLMILPYSVQTGIKKIGILGSTFIISSQEREAGRVCHVEGSAARMVPSPRVIIRHHKIMHN